MNNHFETVRLYSNTTVVALRLTGSRSLSLYKNQAGHETYAHDIVYEARVRIPKTAVPGWALTNRFIDFIHG